MRELRRQVGRHDSYACLCEIVRERGGTIRLSREPGGGWGLLATLPAQADGRPRAAGFVLGDLSELNSLARLLLDWLDAVPEDVHIERGKHEGHLD